MTPRIYETLGDAHAHALINKLLELLAKVAAKYGGAGVKTLGDGLVCAFPLPDHAFQAACDMQAAAPDASPERLGIKIGFTFGPVVLSGGDVFGDTVNVCARLVALANADQVLTTQQTVDALSPGLRTRCRQMFPIRVRGRHEEIIACNVLWRTDPDLTEINLARAAQTRSRETVLKRSRAGQLYIVRSK